MKLKRNNERLLIKLLISILIFLFCLNSCSMRAEQKSLTAQFETIDLLIEQHLIQDADRELKDIQKHLIDSWSYIGVFKRYKILGEYEEAYKIIKKAVDKFGDNEQLIAVYTDFILDDYRKLETGVVRPALPVKTKKNQTGLDVALEYAEKIRDGDYSSLYSEAILLKQKQLDLVEDSLDKFNTYCDERFYDVYYEAYRHSKNPLWLRNCTVLNLARGQFGAAAALYPEYFVDADDAYFWSLVLYDAGQFYNSIATLNTALKQLKDFNKKSAFKVNETKIVALKSDNYIAINDAESAEIVRKDFLERIDTENLSDTELELIPVIMTNSAVWAAEQELDDKCADLLFYVVTKWPDYVPGLIQYANFAYKSSTERYEDAEIKALRKAGIATLEMEKYDSRRKIPVSDALYRMNDSLSRNPNPYLEIKKIDLNYKLDPEKSEKDKNKDLWNLLENNYYSDAKDRCLIIEYALHFLIVTKQYEDAWNLFMRYLRETISLEEDKDFWPQFIRQMNSLDLPIVEFAAWFAADRKLYDETIRLYEYCVYESGGILDEGLVSAKVTNGACMNLADIYYSCGNKEKALELYGCAAGRELNKRKRSDIYYRIATIYENYADVKNALRSAEYAKQIYPENAKAGLLIDRLTAHE